MAVVTADLLAGGKVFGSPFRRETACSEGFGEEAAAIVGTVAFGTGLFIVFSGALMPFYPALTDGVHAMWSAVSC